MCTFTKHDTGQEKTAASGCDRHARSGKMQLSFKAEVTSLAEIPVLSFHVHCYVTVSIPGKLLLSEFIMGKVSPKCVRGDLFLLKSDYIRMYTVQRHRQLSPQVVSRPQYTCRDITIHHINH